MTESNPSEFFFDDILDQMLEGCQILDFDWRYLYVNDAATGHGRLEKSRLIGKILLEVYPGIKDTALFAALKTCMETRISDSMINEFVYPDGSKALFELRIQPVPEGLMVLSLDITERKKADRQVEKLNRAIARNIKAEERLHRTLGELRQANEKLEAEIAERKAAEKTLLISLRFLEIVNRQKELSSLLTDFVSAIKEYSGCEAVGIRVLDDEGNIPYQSYCGFSQEFFESESPLSIKSDQCMCINVIRGDVDPDLSFYTRNGSFYMNGTTRFLATVSEEEKGSTRNVCNLEGYESVALIPFRQGNKILGLIHVADRREDMVPIHLVEILEKSAMQLGPAFERVRAENKLSESESRYRSLFENNHTAILVIDPTDGAIVDANPAAAHYYGWTRETLKTMKMSDINTMSPHNVLTEMKQASADQRHHFIFKHRRANRSIRDVEVFSGPIQLKGRSLLYSVIHDITERKKAEAALLESETHYRSLFDNMLNGLSYCQMIYEDGRPVDFIYIDVNDAFENLTGLRNVTGKKVSEVIPGIQKTDPGIFEVYGRVASTGEPSRFEIYLESMDMWLSVAAYSPKRDHFVTIFDVITDRKKAEQALRQWADAFEFCAHGIAIGLVDTGTILTCNPAFARMYGGPVEDIAGITMLDLYDPEEHEQIRQQLAVSDRDGQVRFEARMQRKDGGTLPVQLDIVSVRGEDGRILYRVDTMQDLSERVRAAEEKEKLESQFRQAQKLEAVGRLAGGVAHDFNNMLQVITGFAEMTLDELEPESRWYSNLLEIQKAAHRSSDLTRQLLAFARKQTVDPKVLDLNETVPGMLKMLRRLIGEDIDLAWMPGHDLWSVKIDPSQIDQILANLAVNARDAINGVGRVTIETENISIDDAYCADHPDFFPGDYVLIAFSDDGCGMDKAMIAQIFEPFFTTKGVGRGTGLGLATIYGIVKQNGGFINVYSEPGQGTTFKIYLPRFAAAPIENRLLPARADLKGGSETVMLVEDESVILNIGKAMLQRLGYEVLTAQRPSEAIRQAEEYSGDIQLLITDVVMPEMNGRDLARHLAAIHPEMRCLYISGYTANLIAHRGILDEGVFFLPKPFSLESLSRKIRDILDRP